MKTIPVVNQEIIQNGMFAMQSTINDITLDDFGNLAIISDLDALMNIIKCVVRVNMGELQYNLRKGVPYFQTIFSEKNLIYLWESYLREAISNVRGVRSIEYVEFDYSPVDDILSYKAGINTQYGAIELNERYI
jgi:hypothetical protein